MSRILEDFLGAEDRDSIDRVILSDSNRFDLLVRLANLKPEEDFKFSDLRGLNFCDADLRGFNFSNSDLRGVIRNNRTMIDSSTNFNKALLDWIEVDDLPIVYKMKEIESATGSIHRRDLLEGLVAEHGRTKHVIKYLVSAAERSKTLDDFIDFASFLPARINFDYLIKLKPIALKLLNKRVGAAKRKSRRGQLSPLVAEAIVDKLHSNPESLAGFIFAKLASGVNEKGQTVSLNWFAHVEVSDLEAAFAAITKNAIIGSDT